MRENERFTQAGTFGQSTASCVKGWSNDAASFPAFDTSPAVANGVAYVSTQYSKGLIALNAKTGDKLWGRIGGQTLASSPTVANGMVYVGSQDDKVYAFGLN